MSADRPLIGVGVVVRRADRVLLVRRAKAPRLGEWAIPGGRQRLGETVRNTAHREVREECGVEIELAGLLDVVDSLHAGADGRISFHYTLIEFLADWVSGEARPGDDVDRAVWADAMELGTYALWSETERLIRKGFDLPARK